MAGSGKTTLIQRINAHLHATKRHGYIINMDPAVASLPYGANIDIRDTVRVRAHERIAERSARARGREATLGRGRWGGVGWGGARVSSG